MPEITPADLENVLSALTESDPDVDFDADPQDFHDFAVALLRVDRVEKFRQLEISLRGIIYDQFRWGRDVEIFFLIDEIAPGRRPHSLELDRALNYDQFRSIILAEFANTDLQTGSPALIKRLHEYFRINGNWMEVVGGGILDHRHDEYLIHSALILLGIHGEDRVLEIFDEVIRNEPIVACDLIRLVSTEKRVEGLPLEWALNLVK